MASLPRQPSDSPPRADTVVSMLRSVTLDTYFHRAALRNICTQRSPVDDFLPQASEIIPGLYVTDLYTATSPATLQQLGITHVVSVVRRPRHRYPPSIAHLCVPVEDKSEESLLAFLDDAVRWIAHARAQAGSRVLVHCVWGMSRSASVVAAFLISTLRLSLDDALRVLRARRRVARPNPGFAAQLRIYERVARLRERAQAAIADRERSSEFDVSREMDTLALQDAAAMQPTYGRVEET